MSLDKAKQTKLNLSIYLRRVSSPRLSPPARLGGQSSRAGGLPPSLSKGFCLRETNIPRLEELLLLLALSGERLEGFLQLLAPSHLRLERRDFLPELGRPRLESLVLLV